MINNDELDEINLECDHSGVSRKRVIAGKKFAVYKLKNIPKWKRQLKSYRAGQQSSKRR